MGQEEIDVRPHDDGVATAQHNAEDEEGQDQQDAIDGFDLVRVGHAHLVHEPVCIEEGRACLKHQIEASIEHEQSIL